MKLTLLSWSTLALAAYAALAACSSGAGGEVQAGEPPEPLFLIPDRETGIFQEAEIWTLFATNPSTPKEEVIEEQSFRGYAVLGRANLSDPAAKRELVESFNAGLFERDGVVPGCFMPRHALRAETESGRAELLICYQCRRIWIFGDGEKRVDAKLTTDRPVVTFDRIFEAHGLTIARR
ncbi:MAG: hypothetical protein AAGI22_09600 [Planctomycetota bacterium]